MKKISKGQGLRAIFQAERSLTYDAINDLVRKLAHIGQSETLADDLTTKFDHIFITSLPSEVMVSLRTLDKLSLGKNHKQSQSFVKNRMGQTSQIFAVFFKGLKIKGTFAWSNEIAFNGYRYKTMAVMPSSAELPSTYKVEIFNKKNVLLATIILP